MTQPSDRWERGDPYEHYVGRWSRQVAPRFLAWLALPREQRWLDIGCGTGALSAAILEHCAPASVDGVEPSEGFLAKAREQLGGRMRLHHAGAGKLPLADGAVDAAVSGLVLNFIPDQKGALAEMLRVTAAGGTIAAYVWDYAGRMELMRQFWDAAAELDRHARELDEGRRFPVCRPDALEALFVGAGLAEVRVEAIDVPTRFRDFDDYWSPFLGGQGPAPGYAVSLSEEKRAALRERLRARLAAGRDGAIELIARAWAVRGRRKA